jgi:hypothetical protein
MVFVRYRYVVRRAAGSCFKLIPVASRVVISDYSRAKKKKRRVCTFYLVIAYIVLSSGVFGIHWLIIMVRMRTASCSFSEQMAISHCGHMYRVRR